MTVHFAANLPSIYSGLRATASVDTDIADLDDLTWPVTTGDCAILIGVSIAALIATGTLAAWLLANIVSIG